MFRHLEGTRLRSDTVAVEAALRPTVACFGTSAARPIFRAWISCGATAIPARRLSAAAEAIVSLRSIGCAGSARPAVACPALFGASLLTRGLAKAFVRFPKDHLPFYSRPVNASSRPCRPRQCLSGTPSCWPPRPSGVQIQATVAHKTTESAMPRGPRKGQAFGSLARRF